MTDLQTTIDIVITETESVSTWSKVNPKLQLAWDSTSYGTLQSCPRMYQLSIIEGYQSTFQAAELEFGIMLHSARETYKKHFVETHDHEASLLAAVRYAILASWDYERNRPWTSDEPTRSRNTLLRTLIWYLDHFKDSNVAVAALPSGKAAVEVSFRIPLNHITEDGNFLSSTNEELYLCGHIDEIDDWEGENWINDLKSTKYELDDNYFRQFSPDNQISIYTIAGNVILPNGIAGMMIDGVQILVNGNRFRRREIPQSPEMLAEWLTDFRYWMAQAEMYAANDYWPMNRKSCGYGRRQCRYRPVCSADPSMREEILHAWYTKRHWDPLRTR